MTLDPEMQWCSRPSYTKCSYVLSMTSQHPAARHSAFALSSSALSMSTPAPHVERATYTSIPRGPRAAAGSLEESCDPAAKKKNAAGCQQTPGSWSLPTQHSLRTRVAREHKRRGRVSAGRAPSPATVGPRVAFAGAAKHQGHRLRFGALACRGAPRPCAPQRVSHHTCGVAWVDDHHHLWRLRATQLLLQPIQVGVPRVPVALPVHHTGGSAGHLDRHEVVEVAVQQGQDRQSRSTSALRRGRQRSPLGRCP
jgi:hypothetical protein